MHSLCYGYFHIILCDTCLSAVPWVGGVDVYTMCAVHRLSALVSWERLCVSIMLNVSTTTDSHIRAVMCRCIAYIIFR